MRVWLDDKRPAPRGWFRVRTPAEAIAALQTGHVTEMSLDHDLGLADEEGRESSGYDVLLWIEEQVITGGFKPPALAIHSDNGGALKKMRLAIENITRRSVA